MRLIGWSVVLLAALAVAFWLGLPLLFRTLGLHPDPAGPVPAFPGHRALIITTSQSVLSPTRTATGVFASEMTAPYYAFRDAGMDVDIASITGGAVPIDPVSFLWFVQSAADRRFREDRVFQEKVRHAAKIDDVDTGAYDIVFLAGGWGAAYDFAQSDVLGRKITAAWAAGRVVGGVCHGPLGLLRATDDTGAPLVRGRHLTAVTDKQVRELGIGMTPMHPERDLRKAGALFESATAFRDIFANHVVEDGRLITGQNQNAGYDVAVRMMMRAGARPSGPITGQVTLPSPLTTSGSPAR